MCRVVCADEGQGGVLTATTTNSSLPSTRFWLGGTTVGSYALRSAANGLYVSSVDGGQLAASALDPRDAAGDGARWWIVTPPGLCPQLTQ